MKSVLNMVKVIVSLTSYPDRIQTVYKVIESLFAQNRKADEIVLWLSTQEFVEKEACLPENLKRLIGVSGFRVEWVYDNLKPHKKYFYILQDNKEDVIITVDDDVYYEENMIRTLVDSWHKHPCAVSARHVHLIFRDGSKVADYDSWESDIEEYIGMERMDLCAVGVSGILYPPGCGNERWFDKETIETIAANQDDLWLKYNEMADGIPVVYTGMDGRDIVIEESQASALYLKNAYGGDNDICIQQLVRRIRENHAEVYCGWLSELRQIRDSLAAKREYYNSEVEKLFTLYGKLDFYICGAGKYARILMEFLKTCGKESYVKAFLVSGNAQHETVVDHVHVKQISGLCEQQPYVVICGVAEKHKAGLKKLVEKDALCQWVEVDLLGIVRLIQLEEKYTN